MSDVSVIGLGAMGSALASAFLSRGFTVTVWNRSAEKAEALAAKGAAVAANAADAVAASKLVAVCLLNYGTVSQALGPASNALKGRGLLNLTNGTPAQARDMGKWAAERGAEYLDGGIMATPPMIGAPEALVLYSGSKTAFEAHQTKLDSLGASKYLGHDAGLAALYDLSLLAGMWGMFAGAIHATALAGTEKVDAREFMAILVPRLHAMVGLLPQLAEQVDSGDYAKGVVSNLAMQAVAYVNLMEASRAQGVSAKLIAPMQDLMNRGVDAGHGNADLSSLVDLIRGRP
ncbi:MAG: NAD(P)-dependent oxidoreductase [Rhizobiales bacterium]|nr:NAD(P)-dependent oxidoreductase [Hyphomicrobiales bacterium]